MPLLFGQGDPLKAGVARVLQDAGFEVEDLDEAFEGSKSADLLVTLDDRHWLVEVTSSSKAPREAEWGNLKGHIALWPTLRPADPSEGGVLTINDHRSLPPTKRPAPYQRPEFVNALDNASHRHVGALRWKEKDVQSIRAAVMGPPHVL